MKCRQVWPCGRAGACLVCGVCTGRVRTWGSLKEQPSSRPRAWPTLFRSTTNLAWGAGGVPRKHRRTVTNYKTRALLCIFKCKTHTHKNGFCLFLTCEAAQPRVCTHRVCTGKEPDRLVGTYTMPMMHTGKMIWPGRERGPRTQLRSRSTTSALCYGARCWLEGILPFKFCFIKNTYRTNCQQKEKSYVSLNI